MNYITEIRAFYDLAMTNRFSTGQIALWHALMHICNKSGWSKWFSAPNITLEILTGLSARSILSARNALKQAGLIDFRTNGTKATSYTLFSIGTSIVASIDTSIDTSRDTSIDASTLNKRNKTKQNKKEIDKEKKTAYGEFGKAMLTEKEHTTLVSRMGENTAAQYIDRLDGWLAEGNCKKNHYATILNWWRRDGEPQDEEKAVIHYGEEPKPRSVEELRSMSLEEMFR